MNTKVKEKPKFKSLYYNVCVPNLVKKFKLTSVMAVPKIQKIVVNIGFGNLINNPKVKDQIFKELSLITGQKPVFTKAKKSIVNFNIRENNIIGCKVTLRNDKMYYFLERLVKVALPRIRDFQGIKNNSFDQNGNFSFGINEHIIFLEIDFDKVIKVVGMDISIVTNKKDKELNFSLLKEFNFPFKRKKK